MLRTRVITGVTLLVLLLALLYANSYTAVVFACALFFGAAAWESFRLFANTYPRFGAVVWTAAFVYTAMSAGRINTTLLFSVCCLVWLLRLIPALKFGLPPQQHMANRLLTGIYGIAIMGCFYAILALFQHSPLYLFSVMALVWVADIGAYFSGKAFGKRKLAPTISPGKSWEGVIGGWLAVLLLASLTAWGASLVPALADTFSVRLQARAGWLVWLAVLTVLVAASVVGDLFESLLKRRAGFKDSSNLLPGHGGVLDRIDALIPSLPLAVLVDAWL